MMLCSEDVEASREAIVNLHRHQNLDALASAVEHGTWTLAEAAEAHESFMRSDVLQTLVALDIATLEAMVSGQVH